MTTPGTPQSAEKARAVQIVRNSRKSFLLGASWSHDPRWSGPRLTHIYLGPWLLTVSTRRRTWPARCDNPACPTCTTGQVECAPGVCLGCDGIVANRPTSGGAS